MTTNPTSETAEALARRFHEAYERMAPSFGYNTRKASAVPWEDVPFTNKQLMIATAAEVIKTSPVLAMSDDEFSLEVQRDCEAHLGTVQEWQGWYESGEPEGERPPGDDPSFGPFCGCDTCVVREVLGIAWPLFIQRARAEVDLETSSSNTGFGSTDVKPAAL